MAMPKQLGRYRIEAELGQGAMGRVYLAHDPAIDRKVALKIIHLPHGLPAAERAEAEARFDREIRAAGRLSHPHIVTIYDVGQDESAGTFVAMEFVEGRTLEAAIGDGHLPDPRIVASIGCQAADALAYAHRNGIIHRDIKPANLILVGGRSVKITDFGLAKPAGSNLTTDGTLLGTPYYMSPEQIEGREVDGRSDLFSLAVVVYEMLTGKRPFRGDSISTVVYRVLHEPPVEPDLNRLPDSSAIKSFLAKALSKDPDRRYADGDAFARALREAISKSEMDGAGETSGPEVAAGMTAAGDVPAERPSADPPAHTSEAPKADRTQPYKPSRARSGKVQVAPGTRRAAKGRKGSRRGGYAGRSRPSRSAMPILALLTVIMALGFVYRDALFELVGPLIFGEGVVSHQEAVAPASAAPSLGGEGQLVAAGAPAGEASDPQDGEADGGQGVEPQAARPPEGGTSEGGQDEPPDSGQAPEGEDMPAAAPAGAASGGAGTPPEGGIRLKSEPEGAVFKVQGRDLPAAILPAPAGGAQVLVEAVLGCRSGSLEVGAAEAGQVVTIPVTNDVVSIRVEAKPGKSAVSLDGEKKGRTPTSLDLDACVEHQIKVEKAEYKPWVRNLKLVDGRLDVPEKLVAELQALPRGTLVAPTAPYELRMVLAGGRRLKPGEEISLVADTYRLSISSDKLLYSRQLRVRVKANEAVTPSVEFPELARFTVLAAPSNAKIEIRGEGGKLDLGYPPVIGQQVVAGTYTLYCRFAHNEEEQTRLIDLHPGDNPKIRFVAEKQP